MSNSNRNSEDQNANMNTGSEGQNLMVSDGNWTGGNSTLFIYYILEKNFSTF
jgi:hypothetical protein